MRPVVIAAIVAGLFAGLEGLLPPLLHDGSTEVQPRLQRSVRMACPRRTIPEGELCVPIPAPEAKESVVGPLEFIPRYPDRPVDFDTLDFGLRQVKTIDFDSEPSRLVRANAGQAWGRFLRLSAARSEPVRIAKLIGQIANGDVLFAGDFVGRSVVTLHRTTDSGKARDYLVVLLGLEGFGPSLAAGQSVAEGDVVGFVGDGASAGEPQLVVEVRLVRDDVDVRPLDVDKLLDPAVSVPIDPRNVFSRRMEAP